MTQTNLARLLITYKMMYQVLEIIPPIIASVVSACSAFISDSEDSENSDDALEPRRKRTKIRDYVVNVVEHYDDEDFRRHFRLNRTSVTELMNRIGPHFEPAFRRPKLNLEHSLLLFLWHIGNQESFRGVADRFGVGEGHAHRVFIKMSKIVSRLTCEIITWPEEEELYRTANKFDELRGAHGFPNVIGCIDCTHIEIPKPKDDNSFYNRNKYHSVIIQAVCDASGAFIDVYVGWPGSVHDARVWQHSPLYDKLTTNPNFLPGNFHLLGDTAYPLNMFMMAPFKDNGFLTAKQRNYNRQLSSKRVQIEIAFGWLKGRFRKLRYLDMHSLNKIKYVLLAACVLHNIAVWQGQDVDDYEEDEGLRVNQDEYVVRNNNRREEVLNAARQKRNEIADLLF